MRSWAASSLAIFGAGLIVATLTTASVMRAAADQRSQDAIAASTAADRLSSSLTAVTTTVAGASVMAVDGVVDDDEFRAFASAVVASSGLTAVAYTELVPGSERASWEAKTGLRMNDIDGSGGFSIAVDRPLHAVVRFVEPLTDATRAVLGFDILSDSIRASAVRGASTGTGASLVGPISLASSARPGLFMAVAVNDPGGTAVGLLSSGISLDDVVGKLEALPHVDGVGIQIDGRPLAGGSSASASDSFELAGRTFTVYAEDRRLSNWLLPLSLASATVLFVALTGFAVQRERRQLVIERRAVVRTRLLAALAEELVNRPSTTAVIRTIVEQAGPIVGAKFTDIGRRLSKNPGKLQVFRDVGLLDESADLSELHDIEDDLPLSEAARTGRLVWIADRIHYAARYPAAMEQVTRSSIQGVCCVPLSLGGDQSIGVIGFSFDEPIGQQRNEIEGLAGLIAQMTGRALERALVREVVQARVDLLADFTRTLTTSQSTGDVLGAVERLLPSLLDLESATLAAAAEDGDACVIVYPPAEPNGQFLLLRRRPARLWTPIDSALAGTVAELIGGALARTRLQDQERAVLHRLQATLLTAAPKVDGYDIAVAYRSALEAVGMGGDWYSIIDTDHAVYAVIGDIVGHGPEAIALMAEVKTVLRHLLTTGVSPEQVLLQADQTLRRRGTYASAIVARLDKKSAELLYYNAGHPPVVVMSKGVIQLLDVVHRPWLGVSTRGLLEPTRIVLADGDLVVLYTDGLVEQRNEVIDISIRQCFQAVDPASDAQQIVTGLINARQSERNDQTVDDDIAVIAIKRVRSDHAPSGPGAEL